MTTIAVIGGGAAGIGAARHLLQQGFRVHLIESGPRLGGNCVGFEVRGSDGSLHTIDAGVSDFNRTTFTAVSALIEELGLPTRPIDQDAHFASPDGRSLWACRGGELQFRECLDGPEETVRREAAEFRTRALEVLWDPRFATSTLGEYLDHIGASQAFRNAIIYPRAAGCFPMPDTDPSRFPARGLVEFWNMHGIVSDRPADRRCVVGGMHRYVHAFEQRFLDDGGELHCRTDVVGISRDGRRVAVRTVDERGRLRTLTVEHVVMTGHARQSLSLLEDASSQETQALACFPSQRARLVIHQDPRLMGSDRAFWGAFHYVVAQGATPRIRPTITFHPNRLGRLPADVPDTFLTMNPHVEPDRVLADLSFLHPIATADAPRRIARVRHLQGGRNTWFAGAWLQSPFVHESALQSGIDAAGQILARESAGPVRSFDPLHAAG